jgi:small subunit ribosomal protein S9
MVEKKETAKKTTAKKTTVKKATAKKVATKEVSTTAKKASTTVKKAVSTKKVVEKKVAVKKGSYIYAVGRRKTSSARVRIYPEGTGKITVNNKDYKDYFPVPDLQRDLVAPLRITGHEKDVDITVRVVGGGVAGQAGAVRHGITRALMNWDLTFRPALKAEGFVTRDPRVKERKKPGLRGARRAPQWSKR